MSAEQHQLESSALSHWPHQSLRHSIDLCLVHHCTSRYKKATSIGAPPRSSLSIISSKKYCKMQLLSLVTLSLVSLTSTLATPAYAPPPSERGYGLAPERRSWSDASKAQAEKIFLANAQKKADEVASKYPVDYRSNVSDYSLWEQFHDGGPVEPIVGKTGATSIGPSNANLDKNRPVSLRSFCLTRIQAMQTHSIA